MANKLTRDIDEVTFKGKTIRRDPEKININKEDVYGYFTSKSRKFNGGGGIIHCPKKFVNKFVCVVVLNKKIK